MPYVRATGKIGLLGLWLGLVPQAASAQALGLPASDPVGIGRSGTGVAFGRSLEAAALNPALLVTLQDAVSAHLGAGLEIQKAEIVVQGAGTDHTSSDRNRPLAAFGLGWRPSEAFALGLKYDEPYLRHREYPPTSSLRFLGRAIDLGTRRVELQGAWAANPRVSVGVGVGLTRVDFAWESAVVLPDLTEHLLRQDGTADALGYTVGFRWAITPRWTVAAAYQGPLEASPAWSASAVGNGTAAARPGAGKVVLPARATLGVRQRVNPFFTWELDLRYIQGKDMEFPSLPRLSSSGGEVAPPPQGSRFRNGLGLSAMGEFSWGKRWTARVGLEFLPALAEDPAASPVLGVSKAAGLSFGMSCKALGGEFSFGYQLRRTIPEASWVLDGVWDAGGYRTTGRETRTKASGHLLAVGYKTAF